MELRTRKANLRIKLDRLQNPVLSPSTIAKPMGQSYVTTTPYTPEQPAPHLLDSPDILGVALHLFPSSLLPKLSLQLLDLFPLRFMFLLCLPHFLHIAKRLRVPALLQVLCERQERGKNSVSGQWKVMNLTRHINVTHTLMLAHFAHF